MAHTNLPHAACWKEATAREVFRTEALEGNDAIFLATHTPIRGFGVSGSSGSELNNATEQGLLDTLANPSRRHAFCAVQGEPGSGKSHLIRWLYINWPNSGDLAILIQRSDGSLEGALRQLENRLPNRFRHLFDRIGQRQKATVHGRAAVFHNTLVALLRPDHYDRPLEDHEWCKSRSPAALLFSERVLSQWRAPERILRLVSGEGERNSATARFGIFDIADLVEIVTDEPTLSRAAKPLLRRLDEEVEEIIRPQRVAGHSADTIQRDFADKLPESIAFIDALNRRRNDAIQNVLGVSAEGLKALFAEVRRELAADGTRLVLLLEDITAWEGLDDSLIDVLVTNAGTHESLSDGVGLCDLVSVVGLTPEYYRTLRGNYRQRITHEVQLGDGEHGLQDVVTVRDPKNRAKFVTRYLAATRAGILALKAWREDIRSESHKPVPSSCDMCRFKDGCFNAFGDIDGVGLYPFTIDAIDGFFDALKDDDAGMTWKTPRGLIQAMLSPTLSQPDVIDKGRYPGPQIDRATFEEQSRHLPAALVRLIEARVDSPDDQARLRRLITFWGAHGHSETTARADGELVFHGIPRAVFESFQLPWLGDEETALDDRSKEEGQADNSSGAPAGSAAPDEEPGEAVKSAPSVNTANARANKEDQDHARSTSESRRSASTRSKPSLDAEDIRSWRDGAQLKNAATWNKVVYEIIQKIDFRLLGADPWIWARYLTPELVKIQGTGQERAYHFVVPAVEWTFDGLEAYAMLKDARDLPHDDIEFYRSQTARMVRQLGFAIEKFLNKRLSVLPDGQRWDPATATAAVLLIRAWLRGAAVPTDPPSQQWTVLLSDEVEADSDPRARTQLWKDLLEATNKRHADLRSTLRQMVATPQGAATGFGIAGGQAAATVVNLIRDLRFPGSPSTIPDYHQSISIIESAAEILDAARKNAPRLLAQELALLTDRAKRIETMLRGRGLREHAMRVDAAITQVSEQLPGASPDRVREWKQSYEKLMALLSEKSLQEEIEDAVQKFAIDASILPTAKPELLSTLISARAGGLEQASEAFSVGETAVEKLLQQVRPIIAEQANDGGLSAIHEKGKRLKFAARDARRRLLKTENV